MKHSTQFKQWFVASALVFSLGGSVVAATTVAVSDAHANKRAATPRKAKTTIEKEFASAKAEAAAARSSPDATKGFNTLKLTTTTPTGQRTIEAYYELPLTDGMSQDVIKLTEATPNGMEVVTTSYAKSPLSLRRSIYKPQADTPDLAASVSSSLTHVERTDGGNTEIKDISIVAKTRNGDEVTLIKLAGRRAPVIDGRIGVEVLRNRAFILQETKWLGASAQAALTKIFDKARDVIAIYGIGGQ